MVSERFGVPRAWRGHWQTRREKNVAVVPGVGVKFLARAEGRWLLKERLRGDDKAPRQPASVIQLSAKLKYLLI